MSDIAAQLRSLEVPVDPGRQASLEIEVVNSSDVVEQYRLEVVGEAEPWSTVEPPTLSLFPGERATATVRFAPPRRADLRPGRLPVAVKVIPTTDPAASVVEEGILVVGSFQAVTAELLPQTVESRRAGRVGVAIDSAGNFPVPTGIRARDPADALVILVRPRQLTLAPGRAHFVRLRLVPKHRFLRGSPKPHRYRVQVEPEGGTPIVLDGTYTQRPLLPLWLLALLALAIIALVWFKGIKPLVESAAKGAVQPALAANAAQSAAVQQRLANTNSAVAGLGSAVNAVAKKVGVTTIPPTTTKPTTVKPPVVKVFVPTTAPTTTTTTSTTTTTIPPFVNTNFSHLLETVAAPINGSATTTYTVPTGDTLTASSLVFQNLQGASPDAPSPTGELRVSELLPGAPGPQNLFFLGLGPLTFQPLNLSTPLVLPAGSVLSLQVSCTGQASCDVGMYVGGTLRVPNS